MGGLPACGALFQLVCENETISVHKAVLCSRSACVSWRPESV